MISHSSAQMNKHVCRYISCECDFGKTDRNSFSISSKLGTIANFGKMVRKLSGFDR